MNCRRALLPLLLNRCVPPCAVRARACARALRSPFAIMTPELERLVDELHDEVAPELRRLTTEAVREAARRATGEEQSDDYDESDEMEIDQVEREDGTRL